MNKVKILTTIALLGTTAYLTGCNSKIKDKLHELAPYVYEVDTYNKLDWDYADKFWADNNDNWGGGCSAVTKMIDGHRIIGRNMDLNISNKCAYIVRTNAGEHKTVGLMYTFRDYSPDYHDVQKSGISSKFYKILPFLCDDVLNDAGLHIEVNMRHGEFYPSGEDMFALEHSNPDDYEGKRRVHMFELPRYIGENCTTVAEAKAYIDTLDIYSKKNYWNYCFIISDAQGNSSLVEFNEIGSAHYFGLNDVSRVTWIDDTPEGLEYLNSYFVTGPTGATQDLQINAIAQTNFYLNWYAFLLEDTKSGEGRFIALQENINDVKSKQDMFDLMDKIAYSNFYKGYQECMDNNFDPRSENIGEGPGLMYNMIFDPSEKTQELVEYYFNTFVVAEYNEYATRQAKRDANKFWETTFCEVVDCMDKVISVRIFEDESYYCNVGIDSTTAYSLD